MYILLWIVHVIVCLFLIIVVLLQSGKAADLAGAFGGMGSQTAFGPRGSATLLSKATTISAILFHGDIAIAFDCGESECGIGDVGIGERTEDGSRQIGATADDSWTAAGEPRRDGTVAAASGSAADTDPIDSGACYAGEEVAP